MSTARRLRTAPAGWSFRFAGAVLVLGFSATMPATAVTIDTFTTNQANVTDPPGTGTSVTGGADIIGTRRGLVPDLLSGAGPVTGGVAAGVLTATVAATTPDSRGEIVVTWDGDALPLVLTPTGLGGVDLTGSNHSGFRFLVNSATAGSELVLEVYTDGSSASRAARRLPAVAAPTSFFLSYASDFVPFLGTGADFADVGAIVLTVRGTETTTVLDIVETATPAIAATKQDRTLGDVPITAPVAPGSTYKYRVAITNTGTEAQTVDVADTIEPNLTIATSTIDATPALINDPYDTFGNVGESDAAPGLLGNDVDPDQNGVPPALVVTAGTVASTLGGSATLAADGSFTYNPPIGVGEAVDTFSYTATDNEGNAANAVATIHIGARIWFVDSSHGGTNQGTFANPFTSITASNLNGAGGVGDLDQPGDILFVYAGAGAYNVGLVLEADQQLIGQGSGLTLQGETIVPAGTAPTFTNGAGSGITLASNNTLMGFTVGNTTVTDIVGTGFGTLTLSNVTLNGSGGALDLATGVLAATFNSISSTNAPVHGINLNAATGTLTVAGSTSVTDAAQAGIRVVNGGSTYSFGATTLASTGFGLDLSNNPTSTFNFTSLAVTTDAGAGLAAANSGTLNISGSSNTIVATGGAAVDIVSTSLGAGATFSTLSSTNSLGKGVNLDTVTGALTANGGTISNAAGACFDVNGGSSNITFAGAVSCSAASRLVEITGRTGGTVTLSGNLTASGSSQGILVQNNSVSGSPIINFSGATKSLNTGANAAVTLDNNDVATINFTGGGLDIDTTSGTGFNATAGAAAITVQGSGNSITTTTGTALNVANSTIGASNLTFQSVSAGTAASGPTNGISLDSTGGAGGLIVTGSGSTTQGGDNSGGTLQRTTGDAIRLVNTRNVSLTNVRIQNVGTGPADGAGGIDATNLQGTNLFRAGRITGMGQQGGNGGTNRNGVTIINTDTDLTMFTVENSVFSSNYGTSSFIFTSARGTSDMGVTVTTSDFSDLVPLAVQVNAGDSETGVHTVTSTISDNVFRNANVADGQGGIAVVSADQDATHNFTVSDNQFYDLIKGIAGGNSEIVLAQTTGGAINGSFLGNTIGTAAFGNGDRRGIGVISEPDLSSNGELGSIDIVIDGNVINRLTNREAIFVDLREDTTNSELIVRNNLIGQLSGFEGQIGGIREAVDIQNRGEVTRTLNLLVSNNNIRTTSSVWAVNLEVNIDNATPGNLTTQATVTGNTISNTGTGDELIARPRDAGAVTTLCLDMNGNTLNSGAGVITLDETGTLNVEQASAAALAAANGIPAGNVQVTGSPSFGVICSTPPI